MKKKAKPEESQFVAQVRAQSWQVWVGDTLLQGTTAEHVARRFAAVIARGREDVRVVCRERRVRAP